MKKVLPFILMIALLAAMQTTFACAATMPAEIEYLPDGSSFVTVIEDVHPSGIQPLSSKTATKTKTTYYKNAAGDVMWWVRVTGTFTYGNGTSKCISAKGSAASENSTWKVSNISDSKSGNTASAKATGTHYSQGMVSSTKTKTVTLKCSSTGVFS